MALLHLVTTKTSIMRNYILTAFVVFGFSLASFAQKPYARLGVGYGFNYGTKITLYNSNFNGSQNDIKGTFASFGQGINLGGAFGLMLSDYVGLEMGISYLPGNSIESETKSNSGVNLISVSNKLKGKMLEIIPAIVLTTGSEGIRPYARFGLIIGLFGSILVEDMTQNIVPFFSSSTTLKTKYSGGVAWGFNSAVGAIFPLNDALSIYSELNLVSLSYAPKKGEVTESTVNGQDNLPSLPKSAKEFEFVCEYADYNDPDAPSQELKTYYPFSSIGLNVGLVYSF